MNTDQAQAYKKEVADHYSRRSQTYDNSAWHDQMARKLVDYANIKNDSQVLDIGTGTGTVAFYAASKTGPQGLVLGIDISEGMIERARLKLHDAKLPNIRFELGDGESLSDASSSFDFILCGSAFIWMTDLHATLTHWRAHLKPHGKVGFHAFSENAFVTGIVAQSVLLKYGVLYLMSQPTGTIEKCHKLLEQSGYKNVDIKAEKDGTYIDIEEARNSWVSILHPAPGQFPHPLASLTPDQLACARVDYEREIEKLNTTKGIWNDMTTFYVFGER
ncbi:MAG: class I SAM-dependent methyltransferase [Methylobacter sp.]